MHNSFLIFDFGADEAAAQQARHKLDGWKQAFRLDKKLLYKFEREPGEEATDPGEAATPTSAPRKSTPKSAKVSGGKGKSAKASSKGEPDSESTAAAEEGAAPPSRDIKLIVRLYFSGHEKLSHQRWLDRIPSEDPFKSAKGET